MQPKIQSWAHLIQEFHGLLGGARYQVTKAFVDADGDEHKSGESWLLMGSMFSKFDDLVTLCVRLENSDEFELPLSWRNREQSQVIQEFSKYLIQE